MYECDEKICNTVREPDCPRSPRSAYSVTGTGPGAACFPPKETVIPSPPPKLGCRINVVVSNKRNYNALNGGASIKGC